MTDILPKRPKRPRDPAQPPNGEARAVQEAERGVLAPSRRGLSVRRVNPNQSSAVRPARGALARTIGSMRG